MLQEKINKDVIQALKNKEELRLMTLRLLTSGLHNLEIEKKAKSGVAELSDVEVIELLRKEVRKRKEAIELYKKGGRSELATKEEAEIKVIGEYLPPDLGEEEVKKAVIEAIAKIAPKGPQDFGRVMGEAMKVLKGRAEAANVSRLVKEALPSGE